MKVLTSQSQILPHPTPAAPSPHVGQQVVDATKDIDTCPIEPN